MQAITVRHRDAGVGGGKLIGPFRRIVVLAVLSRFARQRLRFALTKVTQEDLIYLSKAIGGGRLSQVIDRAYPLDQVPDAIRHVESEHARGKVVVRVRTSDH